MVDGCAYGLRHPRTQILQHKRWHLNSSDRVFCQTLEQTCPKDHVHQPLEGAAVTLSASYPWKMVEKLAKYFVQVSVKNDVSRLKYDMSYTYGDDAIDIDLADGEEKTATDT